MSDLSPPLGPLLEALSPYLDELSLIECLVAVTVSPPRGRRKVRFSALVAPGEDTLEILRDACLEAIQWLNLQPEVGRRIRVEGESIP